MDATRILLEPSQARPTTRESSPPKAISPASAPSPSAPPRGRGWSRLLRWSIGGAMLAEAAYLVLPSVLYRTSVQASVTAPLATVRVYQPGVVVGTPPEVGDPVSPGQTLFEVREGSPDLRPSGQIEAERESVRLAADALRAQLDELDALKATLGTHFDAYREARIGRAETLLAEQDSQVAAAESRLEEAEFECRVHGQLASRAASSDVERARAGLALAVARDELEVARQARERQRLQLDAARRGLFVGEADGGQDRVASLQRCDEIMLQQAGLRARLGELDGRLVELGARLDAEREHLADGRHEVVSPIGGLVWSSSLATGVEVEPGATAVEVVDPALLGIEAFFKEADAGRVRPGTAVEARLVGSTRILPGRVVRVSDPRAIDPRRIGGAERDSVPPGTFRAVVELEVQPESGDLADRHHIGVPAIVWVRR
ncbi:HlyD family secretion protein [Tautonia plasticadhaerens]|nr:HlyD family efflux transporter periplasmic adaptor subunit [Tautonia plasticadhaerens]